MQSSERQIIMRLSSLTRIYILPGLTRMCRLINIENGWLPKKWVGLLSIHPDTK